MNRIALITIILGVHFFDFRLCAQATDLLITEYVEGTGSNKYIEIHNGTSGSINLGDYKLQLFQNGSITPSNSNTLSGTLGVGQVVVYRNASATLYTGTAISVSSMNFNGDDAIALLKISTNTYVDVFGNIGCDPGLSWESNNNTTKAKTLRRKSKVCSGVTLDNAANCPFLTLESEWEEKALNDVSDLGKHTVFCETCVAESAPIVASTGLKSKVACTNADLTWTRGDGYKCIVVVSITHSFDLPISRNQYDSDTTYSSGFLLGGDNYVVYNGDDDHVTISNLLPNTTYYVAIFEYNGAIKNCTEAYLTGVYAQASFLTLGNCGGPQIRSALVDVCSSTEGLDEYLILQNGAEPTHINDLDLLLPTSDRFCAMDCGGNILVNNASHIQNMNLKAGCNLFRFDSIIPPNAIFLIFLGNQPTSVIDFSSQCPSYRDYWVAFCHNNVTFGFLANSGPGERTIHLTTKSYKDQVTYNPSECLGNGTYVDFTEAGTALYRNELECVYPLSRTIEDWQIIQKDEGILHQWKLDSSGIGKFVELSYSLDGFDFQLVKRIDVTKGDNHYLDHVRFDNRYYYRLKLLTEDNDELWSETQSISILQKRRFCFYANNEIVFSEPFQKNVIVELIQFNGQLVNKLVIDSGVQKVQQFLVTGMYYLNVMEADSGKIVQYKLMTENY